MLADRLRPLAPRLSRATRGGPGATSFRYPLDQTSHPLVTFVASLAPLPNCFATEGGVCKGKRMGKGKRKIKPNSKQLTKHYLKSCLPCGEVKVWQVSLHV